MKARSCLGKDSVLFVSWRGNDEVSSRRALKKARNALITARVTKLMLTLCPQALLVVRVHGLEVTSLQTIPPPLKLWWIAAIPCPSVVFGECQLGPCIINPNYGTLF